jgi:hypothetical protein
MRHPTIRVLAIRLAVLTGVWALMLGVWALTSPETFWPGDVFRPLMLAFAVEAWVAVLATRPGRRPAGNPGFWGHAGIVAALWFYLEWAPEAWWPGSVLVGLAVAAPATPGSTTYYEHPHLNRFHRR